MKLTKKQEADLARAYRCAMEVGILNMKAPLRYINQYIAEDVNGYGTASDEKVRSRKDFRKMAMDARRQSKDAMFRAKIITPYRPKFINETTAQFRDEIVVQIGEKKNKHTLNLWFSTVYRYQHNKWQMVMFHGSMPDQASSSADTFHVAEAEKKLKELEKIVEQRTIELQTKNSELEIETSLERVRTVAMGMKKRDDMLKICKTISQQLRKLGVKEIRNVQTAIFYPGKGTYMNYEFYAKHNKTFITDVSYKTHKVQQNFAQTMMKGEGASELKQFKGKKLKDWYAYQKTTNQFADKYLLKAHSLNYYWYSLGSVAMGISTYQPLTKDEQELFARFRNVFELAYKRYIDIEKAEAQAREAQIEVALERVRARTIAMHKSDELREVVGEFFGQVQSLGIKIQMFVIFIFKPDGGMEWWGTEFGDKGLPQSYDIPPLTEFANHSRARNLLEIKKKKTPYQVFELSGVEKKNWDQFLLEKTGLKQLPAPIKKGMRSLDKIVLCDSVCDHGILEVAGPVALSKEHANILQRFTKVFEQTYTRFLDVQKAEAQAREAQIEAALERVRARSMAMHKSEELAAVASVLFHQLQELDLPDLRRCLIGIVDEKNKKLQSWHTSLHGDSTHNILEYPIDGHPVIKEKIKGWKKQKPFSIELSPVKLRSFITYIVKHGFKYNKGEKPATKLIQNHAPFNHGYLEVATHEPITESDFQLLQRFAKVFEQTYTRFLDLQKAEAQARESEIQLALERVRARTMAMHKSDELSETVAILFQQFNELGSTPERINICLMKEEQGIMEVWSTEQGGKQIDHSFSGSIYEPTTIAKVYKGWKKRKKSMIIDLVGKELDDWIRYLKEEIKLPFKEELRHERRVHTTAIFSNGALLISTPEPVPQETISLLERFADVFNLTYRRFIDLQNAEAQARESEIQLALERVRARTMAMHKSEELQDVASLLYKEFQDLGVTAFLNCGYVEVDEENKTQHGWMTSPDGTFMEKFHLPLSGEPAFEARYEAWKKQEPIYHQVIGGAALVKHIEVASRHFGSDEVEKMVKSKFPDPTIFYCGNFSKGYLHLVTGNLLTADEESLFGRFTRAFEMTYKRFLDLQKAEAQAREAQIEAALERVRARAMAMRSSEELKEVSLELRKQMGLLGQKNLEVCAIHLYEEDEDFFESWGAMRPPGMEDEILQGTAKFPKSGIRIVDEMMQLYHSGKKDYVLVNEKEKAVEWFNVLKKYSPQAYEALMMAVKDIPIEKLIAYWALSDFSGGSMLMVTHSYPDKDSLNLLRRSSNVFDLAYRRFKDLKKAEAQAREAQIEAALERVRSRSIGMQKSEELKEVIRVVFDQFVRLNINVDHAGFVVDYTPKGDWHFWIADKQEIPSKITHPYFDSIWAHQFDEAKEKGIDFFATHLNFEEKNKFYEELLSYIPGLPEESRNFYFNCPGFAATTVLNDDVSLYIENFSGAPYNDEENKILMRFGKVFQQTYTRFLDLQKSEAQAREAKIEAALERVRARTMAMHKSDELAEVATVLFDQMSLLDDTPDRFNIRIVNEAEGVFEFWATDQEGRLVNKFFKAAFNDSPVVLQMYNSWKAKEKLLIQDIYGDQLSEWVHYIKDVLGVPFNLEHLKEHRFLSSFFFSHGMIGITTNDEPNTITLQLIERFTKVFQQTYTRFLDLQKAEAQAREAQVEAALERVRAQTMAMHKSEELINVIGAVFEQLKLLNFKIDAASISLNYKEAPFKYWMAIAGHPYPTEIIVPHKDIAVMNRLIKDAGSGYKAFNEVFDFDEKNEWVDHILKDTIVGQVDNERKKFMYESPGLSISVCIAKNVALTAASYSREYFQEDQVEIQKRFANVFEQTYTRFLDLQKAEAQAREAQIETALERVRSRSIAMRRSEEIAEIAGKIFSELKQLDLALNRVLIWTFNEAEKYTTWWSANPEVENTAESYRIDYNENPVFINYLQAWQQRKPIHLFTLSGDTKKTWEDHLFEHTEMSRLPMAVRNGMREEDTLYTVSVISDFGIMMSGSFEPLPDASIDIIQRFGRVFQQSYTRYLDVQKAEAQAREAKIEAALERVRSKAMSMHSSEDLAQTVDTFFIELNGLNVKPRRCGVGIIDKESHTVNLTATTATQVSDTKMVTGYLNLYGHPVLSKIFDSWLEQEEYHPVLRGKEIGEYYKVMNPQVAFPDFTEDETQYGYYFFFKEGGVFAWTDTELSEMDLQIFRRYTSVLSLTYRRYMELQKSEANAKEAIKQAALDRIRADIASMRTIDDLDRITPLIWNELTILGIPFIRCGVFIMDESQQLIHTFLSTPDGKAIAAFHLSYDTPGNLQKVVSNWKEKKNYIDHWDEEEFTQFAEILVKQGALESAELYLKTIPHGGFHLHFLPFLQGMLYVGNTTQLREEEIDLIQSVADAFSTAYARYEDFNKLEAAKKQVDSTLHDLQEAQKQLIQSEKMASLGELTAGIAHEIQNPLNFVNNFSDVSSELIQEMKDELEKGNAEDALIIAEDVLQNLEKILHHGKRADGIVKGMLQHSRSSSGQKELTDINVLADEYLRLAYHGLRAKDKSFNAKFETHFDESIEKLNIVPQDMGRVILNLINNAFYTVSEKQTLRQTQGDNYEPTVVVVTKKENGKVFISVKDNGNGIPASVKEKIFQPFFTTKPTGQGTGLGLSLSYDIIKAHGGEFKVETKEGEGSEFIIQLPV